MMSRRRFFSLLAAAPLLGGAAFAAKASIERRYHSGPISDHFDGERFFNPGSEGGLRSFGDFLRWQFNRTATAWPDTFPSPFIDAQPPRPNSDALRVTFVGHATFFIQVGGLNVLTDPVWSERASPVQFAGPKRHNLPGIAFEALPRIDAVLISHSHYDHLDLHTLARLWKRDRPHIVAPLGNAAIIQAKHPDIAVTSTDWGDHVPIVGLGSAATIVTQPAHHWSARKLGDRNRALWASYMIRSAGHTVYFAGDTGFGQGRNFENLAAWYPRIDLALLPIGSYEPRWFMKEQHMNPEDAVRAFRILNPDRAIGFHWGTFRLTDEGVEEPARDLEQALTQQQIDSDRFVAGLPGQVWQFGEG